MNKPVSKERRNSDANKREVMNSQQNLVAINKAIKSATTTMRELNNALNGIYEEYDRRYDKYDEAVMALNGALLALETLRRYELETIELCTEG